MRKVDIAHSGQTVVEAMKQLEAEVKNARRARESALLLVHGFGASGAGGAIKAALATELPRLARNYVFKAYSYSNKDQIPRRAEVDPRRLNPRLHSAHLSPSPTGQGGGARFPPQFPDLAIESQGSCRAARVKSQKGGATVSGRGLPKRRLRLPAQLWSSCSVSHRVSRAIIWTSPTSTPVATPRGTRA